jgi:uncharacterized membrane protein
MLGILLLIGPIAGAWNAFWRLALKYERSKVGYAFLGVGVYIVSQLILGFVIGMVIAFTNASFLSGSPLLMNFIGIAFGGMCAWIVYYLLEKAWAKQEPKTDESLLDNEL